MKFGYTILYVPEVEAAIAFYEAAFGFKRRFVSPDGGYGELETGATALAFVSRAQIESLGKRPAEADAKAPGFEIALTTADVPAAVVRAVAAGATAERPVEVMPWGQTIAYVADPNGILIEICTPMGDA